MKHEGEKPMKTMDETIAELKMAQLLEHTRMETIRLQEKIQKVTLLLSRFVKIAAKTPVSKDDVKFANEIASALVDAEKLMPLLNVESRKLDTSKGAVSSEIEKLFNDKEE